MYSHEEDENEDVVALRPTVGVLFPFIGEIVFNGPDNGDIWVDCDDPVYDGVRENQIPYILM